MARILVTGSNGQLGNELKYIAGAYPELEFHFIDVEQLDLTQADKVELFFNSSKPFDFIVNCAAYTAVDKAEQEIEKAREINGKAVLHLAIQAKKYNAKFIHISTDYVFDGTKNTPYTEDDLVNPVSAYGSSKLEGEMFAINSGASFMIIRTSWLYSPYGANFIKTILRIAQERKQIKVVLDQVGNPTYAADLARAIAEIIHLCHHNPQRFMPGIYHYSNEGVCSWFDVAYEIIVSIGLKTEVIPIKSKEFPSPVKRPNYSVLNKSKIKETYGLCIPHWRQSLKDCLVRIINDPRPN